MKIYAKAFMEGSNMKIADRRSVIALFLLISLCAVIAVIGTAGSGAPKTDSVASGDQKTSKPIEAVAAKPTAPRPTKAAKIEPTKDSRLSDPVHQIAIIDTGGMLREDDIRLTRIRYLMDAIREKTGNTAQEIADMTVNCQQILRKDYGKEITLQQLLEDAKDLLDTGVEIKYSELMVAIAVTYGQ